MDTKKAKRYFYFNISKEEVKRQFQQNPKFKEQIEKFSVDNLPEFPEWYFFTQIVNISSKEQVTGICEVLLRNYHELNKTTGNSPKEFLDYFQYMFDINYKGIDIEKLPVIQSWLNTAIEYWRKERPYITWIKPTKKPTAKPELKLEDIIEKKDLNKLVELLKEKGFVKVEKGKIFWTGIEHDIANGIGLQLVALAEVCRPLYKLTKYTAKDLNKVWKTYFNYKMEVTKWQRGEIKNEYFLQHYPPLFRFVNHSFKINLS